MSFKIGIGQTYSASGYINQNEVKMMNISINTNSAMMYGGMQGMKGMQPPDPSKIASDLFSKLDTSGKGYVSKADVESAFGQLSNSSSSNGSNTTQAADAFFSKLDTKGDGKVTKEEITSTLENVAKQLDGLFPRMRLQMQDGQNASLQMPQQLDKSNQSDQGISKDQLNVILKQIDDADKQSSNSVSNTDDSAAASKTTSDVHFMKQMMQLLKAYGEPSNQNSNFTTSA